MGVQIVRGSRSEKYAAKDWECDCGHNNRRKQFLIFDLPVFFCERCKKKYDGVVYFNLADVEVNGRSIIPEVKDQSGKPECAPFAFSHAQELNDAIEAIIMSDNSAIESLDPMVLADTYSTMFMVETEGDYAGLHKLLYTAMILHEKSREIVKDDERSEHSECCFGNYGKPEHICQFIADGRGVVGCFRAGEKLAELQFGEVYSETKDPKSELHAVVLIGALLCANRIIYIFLNSWGKTFCCLRDENGDIITGGIGMVESSLWCNPIVLSRSWEEGNDGKLTGKWKKRSQMNSNEVDEEIEQLTLPRGRVTFINKEVWDSCKACSAQRTLSPTPSPYSKKRLEHRAEDSFEDAAVCTQILEGHSDAITSTRFIDKAEGSLHVVTGSNDRSLRLYKCDTSVSMDYPEWVGAYKILCVHMTSVKSISTDLFGKMLWSLEGSEDDDAVSLKKRRQLLVLETNLLLSGLALHDENEDMILDINNMSYEEILVLDDHIGSDSTKQEIWVQI